MCGCLFTSRRPSFTAGSWPRPPGQWPFIGKRPTNQMSLRGGFSCFKDRGWLVSEWLFRGWARGLETLSTFSCSISCFSHSRKSSQSCWVFHDSCSRCIELSWSCRPWVVLVVLETSLDGSWRWKRNDVVGVNDKELLWKKKESEWLLRSVKKW